MTSRGRHSIDGMAYYVTTPIYYVNAQPHLGHAYTTIAADILARHMRQRGEDVFFLTGTDEHGEPVTLAAEREGITPRELGDRNAVRFRDMAERVNATNDFFIRTSDPEHMAAVQDVLQRVYDNGHVYKGALRGLVLPALRGLQDRAGDRRGQPLPDPRDRARRASTRRTTSSGSPPSRSRSRSCTPTGPSGCARRTATTRRCRSSRAG